ncbi:MAG: tetratricopeptide repeat protein [Synergistaceae bacterium]|nr:tetratricopeptide repeat protein [Synergistaceae bacterium]
MPLRKSFGIVEGMAALPNGDILVKDRPSGYAPGDPSIGLLKNARPVSVPEPGKQEKGLASNEQVETGKDDPAAGDSIEAELARLKKALKLRQEVTLLEEEGDLKGAVEKYRESLKYYEDPAVAPYAEGLEKIASIPPAADFKGQQAHAKLEPRPKPTVTPKEPLIVPEQEILAQPVTAQQKPPVKAVAPPLEDPRKKAEVLWNEAAALQQAFKYEEALELYKKGLEISPDEVVKDHANKLEAFIPKAKARAEQIWNEAAALQTAKKYQEALEKYRQGLGIYHNQKVEDHVGKLEIFIARQKL